MCLFGTLFVLGGGAYMFQPKLITTLKTYSLDQFFKDISAGLIVAVIALPLSIALAIASGVVPEKGLYTAIVAGFLISLLGGSRVQIGGPTGAFVIIVFDIVQKYGVSGLVAATFMAGLILVFFGLIKVGSYIRFIPYPIVTGFTSGIALTIFTTQVKDFLGLSLGGTVSGFAPSWSAYLSHIGTTNIYSALVGFGSLFIIFLFPKINRKIPGSLVAVLVSSLLVFFTGIPVETVGSRFGELSSSLPSFTLPHLSPGVVSELIGPALTIAVLAAVESLLSAVVADGMIGTAHRPNTELIAQGVANTFSALFGGIPATGAIARTAANINNGGRTPVAGIVHAVVLAFMLVFLMPFVSYVPMASLAAVLVVVAYNMSEWRSFVGIFSAPKSDMVVLLVTFFLTLFAGLVVAIQAGMILAAFLFMKRMSDVCTVKVVDCDSEASELEDEAGFKSFNSLKLPDGVGVYEINGPFFFGAADMFLKAFLQTKKPYSILIMRMRNVPAMDVTGFVALKKIMRECQKGGTRLFLSGVQEQPLRLMEKKGLSENDDSFLIFSDMESALARAEEVSRGVQSVG